MRCKAQKTGKLNKVSNLARARGGPPFALSRSLPCMVVTCPGIQSGSATAAMGSELLPTAIADGPRDIGTSETVIGTAPGVRVVPAIEMALLDSGCETWPLTWRLDLQFECQ